MAVFTTDFSEYATGAIPADWARVGGALDWQVVEDVTAEGGKKLQLLTPAAIGAITWTDLDATGDFHALLKFLTSDRAGLIFQQSGTAGDVGDAYVARRNGSSFHIAYYVGGSLSTFVGFTSFSWTADAFYWMRVKRTADRLEMKVWKHGDEEPAAFQVDTTHSGILTAGKIGVFTQFAGTKEYDYLSVATAGEDPVDPTSIPPLPDAPNHTVCTASAVEQTTATLSGGTYIHQDLLAHKDSRWQIRRTDGEAGWGTPVFDSGWDAVNLTTIDVTGLVPGVSYEAQVIYRGTNDVESGVAETALFSTIVEATLTRLSTGLLFRDQFDRPDGAPGNGWTSSNYLSPPLATDPPTYPADPYVSGFNGAMHTRDGFCSEMGDGTYPSNILQRSHLASSGFISGGELVISTGLSSDNSALVCSVILDGEGEEVPVPPGDTTFVEPMHNTSLGPLREYVVQLDVNSRLLNADNWGYMAGIARTVPRIAPDWDGQLGTDTITFGIFPESNLQKTTVERSQADFSYLGVLQPGGSSSTYHQSYSSPALAANAWMKQKAWVQLGRLRTYARGEVTGDLAPRLDTDVTSVRSGWSQATVDGILANEDGGYPGFCAFLFNKGSGATCKVRDFSVYESNLVTVTGLPTGYTVRALFPTSSGWISPIPTAKFAETAGVAEVDIGGAMCPDVRLEVFDAEDRSVGVYTGEEGEVWGGDVYTFNFTITVPTVETPLEKAWAFTLDGHVFYVLNTVEDDTIVCDLTTGQWHHWKTGEHSFWNMFRGVMWKGRILAADVSAGKIWELDPSSSLDEGTTEIERAVTGFQAIRGRNSYRQGSLRLTASVGAPSADPATVQMRFSDDGGNTWSGYYTVTLVAGDFDQPIEWRSLGRLRAPGRIWEITDEGGLVNIEGLDSNVETPQ